mgnify:CR=1 FL=1
MTHEARRLRQELAAQERGRGKPASGRTTRCVSGLWCPGSSTFPRAWRDRCRPERARRPAGTRSTRKHAPHACRRMHRLRGPPSRLSLLALPDRAHLWRP